MSHVQVPPGFKPAQFDGAYLQHVGPYYVSKQADTCQVGLPVGPAHINYIDVAHGGVLTTLADVALSFQVFLSEKPNPAVSTVNLNTNFVSPARLGDWLIADGFIDRLGKTTALVHGSIRCEDRLVMTMNAVFNIRRR